jgi:hypothetical protein
LSSPTTTRIPVNARSAKPSRQATVTQSASYGPMSPKKPISRPC